MKQIIVALSAALMLSACLEDKAGSSSPKPDNPPASQQQSQPQTENRPTQPPPRPQTPDREETPTPTPAPYKPVASSNFGQYEIDAFGYKWVVRDSSWRDGGPQVNDEWSFANVVKNDNGLDLKISHNAKGEPVGAELISVDSMGYGEYELAFESDWSRFDNSVVFGFFTYNWLEDTPGYQEIDAIETSRWGNTLLKSKATYYPDNEFKNRVTGPDYFWPESMRKGIVRMRWSKNRVDWTFLDGSTGKVVYTASRTERVPVPGKQQVHINLWNSDEGDWKNAKPQTVRLTGFKYTPSDR
ncbi:family 16 glycosylhydrolase [Eikenella corrodens]|uniref:Glycosyl hydrolase family protein n=1 Tax=Eikenella corrodens TaxID=539 RepID=A0A3S9SKA2_EIKCO|nr:family 16 glycosylhydrolase [Eikenella corrodens]AZR59953.1 glycosyl hydrolase family protein [Eikenella corrodens]